MKQQAAEAIRAHVLDGTLVSGELYSVNVIATALGVSRTPVREALIDLAAQGLVHFERNRGVRITRLGHDDLAEIAELRNLLEVPAARVAAVRITEAGLADLARCYEAMVSAAGADDISAFHRADRSFHRAVLDACGNQRLSDFVVGLVDQTLAHGVAIAGRAMPLSTLVQQHGAVVDAIRVRDSLLAGQAMQAILTAAARARHNEEPELDLLRTLR